MDFNTQGSLDIKIAENQESVVFTIKNEDEIGLVMRMTYDEFTDMVERCTKMRNSWALARLQKITAQYKEILENADPK